MEEKLEELLDEYRDVNSRQKLIGFLKDRLVKEMEDVEVPTDRQKHDLNLLVRELEEELDWIETEKLSEFDPEQQ